jgi:excisionase family DNA binding protein
MMEARPTVTCQTIGVDEAAVIIGCSPNHVRRLINQGGGFPGRRVGRLYRVHRAQLDAWLRVGASPPARTSKQPQSPWT